MKNGQILPFRRPEKTFWFVLPASWLVSITITASVLTMLAAVSRNSLVLNSASVTPQDIVETIHCLRSFDGAGSKGRQVKTHWNRLANYRLPHHSFTGIAVRLSVSRTRDHHCNQCGPDEVRDPGDGFSYIRGLESYRIYLFVPVPPDVGLSSGTTGSASSLSPSSLSEPCLIGSAICNLFTSRVSRAVDHCIALIRRSGSGIILVVAGRGKPLWRDSDILGEHQREKRKEKRARWKKNIFL